METLAADLLMPASALLAGVALYEACMSGLATRFFMLFCNLTLSAVGAGVALEAVPLPQQHDALVLTALAGAMLGGLAWALLYQADHA